MAQKNETTFGLQFKPIIPVDFFFTEGTKITTNSVRFTLKQGVGLSGGMLIRQSIAKKIAVETGINYVQRKYHIEIEDTSFYHKALFKIVSYEIPINALVFIQLAKKFYMNTSLGISLDMFPSNIFSSDYFHEHYSERNFILQPGLNANLGYEYRTKKGNFYLGASFHRPITKMYNTAVAYTDKNGLTSSINTSITGNYLTIDFKYYFPLDGKKKKDN